MKVFIGTLEIIMYCRQKLHDDISIFNNNFNLNIFHTYKHMFIEKLI